MMRSHVDNPFPKSSQLNNLTINWEIYREKEPNELIFGWFNGSQGKLGDIGKVLAVGTQLGICGLGFSRVIGEDKTWEHFEKKWSKARFKEDAESLKRFVIPIINLEGQTTAIVSGPRQFMNIWATLIKNVPTGKSMTYGELATEAGIKKGFPRVAANAMSTNRLGLLIPCHRIEQKGQKSEKGQKYRWGIEIKAELRMLEQQNFSGAGPNPY